MSSFTRAVTSMAGVFTMSAFLAGSATAAPIIFDQIEQGGNVSNPSPGVFVGTNIIFEFITYNGQIAYCGSTFTLVGPNAGTNTNCLLNFNTATGFFQLTAPSGLYDSSGPSGFPGLLIPGTTGLVLNGTGFTSFGFTDNGTKFTALGTDTKNAALLLYFGITSTDFIFNNTDIRLTSSGNVTQADLTNDAVPEPGVIALFGLGLLGVGRGLMRKRARS